MSERPIAIPGIHQQEWEERSRRRGLQSVMSTRWTDEQCSEATELFNITILSMLGDIDGRSILEVGPGIGRITAKLIAAGGNVIGADLSYSMIVRANKESQIGQNKGYIFVNALTPGLPFSDEVFDTALEVTVLQHVTHDLIYRQAIHDMKRVVKRSGTMLLCDELHQNRTRNVSLFTRLRTLKHYQMAMKDWNLEDLRQFTCVTDPYTLMLWSRP